MKIVKEVSKKNKLVPITFRLPEALLVETKKLAKKHKISRQKLVASMLEQVLQDDKFELKVRE